MFRPVSTPADAIHRYSLFVLGITASHLRGRLHPARRRDRSVPPPARRRRLGAAPDLRQRAGRGRVDGDSDPDRDRAGADDGADRVRGAGPRRARRAALEVTAIGRQWWWEFRYPAYGIVTANELHVPVSDAAHPSPTFLRLESADVAHSFWVPRLAGKTDLIPNRVNETWIDPRETGLFEGQCAEYCGTQHAKMLLRVYVHSREDFDRWVAAQRASAAGRCRRPSEGRRVFETTACLELPHGPRHRRQRPLRAGPDAPDEPRDDRRRSRAEHARSSCAPGCATRTP